MGTGERRERFETPSGIELERLYGPDEVPIAYDADLGDAGSLPFTRGIHPTMYRGRLWTMRQYAGFGTAEETNARFRYLLESGQTGLSIAFDLPTQMGYDSADPMAEGEVGRVGVAIDTLDDMRRLFEGIPLDRVSTSMTINATAPILLALYVALADERGTPRSSLRGTVQNDILKEFVARGTYIYPVEASLRLVTELFAFCAADVPKWNPISISGYHMREAGATATQEIAFTLANGREYIRCALGAGLALDQTPVPDDSDRSPRVPDADRTWLTLGLTYSHTRNLSFDLGYAHLFVDDPELDDVSDNNDPTQPFPAGLTGFHSVSGSYDSAVDIFGAQVNWRFN
ncbi:MAG: methylmalonyl-CoA mutase family protein [Gemmatimonadales bacterium]